MAGTEVPGVEGAGVSGPEEGVTTIVSCGIGVAVPGDRVVAPPAGAVAGAGVVAAVLCPCRFFRLVLASLLGAVVAVTVGPAAGGTTGVEGVPRDAGCFAGVGATAEAVVLLVVDSPVIAASVSVAAVLECFFFFVLFATEGDALTPGAEGAVTAALEPDVEDFVGTTAFVALTMVDPGVALAEAAVDALLCFFRWEEWVAGAAVVVSEVGSPVSTAEVVA